VRAMLAGTTNALADGKELPEPTTPASWPVKVSVPCPTVRPVLQSMIVVKSATDTPVKLPL